MSRYTQEERDEIMRKARENVRLSPRAAALPLHIPETNTVQAWADWHDARAEEKAQADRERHAEERRQRDELVESAAITQIKGELEELRSLIAGGDTEVLMTVRTAVFPMFETVCENLNRKIQDIGSRVDRRLDDMQNEIRSAIVKHQRAGEMIDMPRRTAFGPN